ncbi:MAG: hypothetical protein KGL04_01825 [Elusimicrobia bacterium]|nr:hypothetical protein [Elusimicrobiota bacterium]
MKLLSKAAAVSCAALILLSPGTGCWTALAGDFAAPEAEGLHAESAVMAMPGAREIPLNAALPIEALGADARIPNLNGISGVQVPAAGAELQAESPALTQTGAPEVLAAQANARPAQAAVTPAEPGAEQALQAKTLILRRRTILGRTAAAVKTALSGKSRAQNAASARLEGERTFDGLGAVSRAAGISAEAPAALFETSAARTRGDLAAALKASSPEGGAASAQGVPSAAHSAKAAVVPAMLAISLGSGFLHVGVILGTAVAGMFIGGAIGRRKGLASRTGGGGGYWDFGTPLYTLIGGLIGAGVGGITGAVLVSLHAVSLAALGGSLLHAALPGIGGAALGAVLGGYLGVKKAKADGGGGGYFNIGPTLYGGLGALIGAGVLGTAGAVLGAHFLGAHAAAHAAAAAASSGAELPQATAAAFMGFPPGWSVPAAQAYVPSQGQIWMAAIKGMLPALKIYAVAAAVVLGAALSAYAALLLTELRGLKKGKPGKTGGSSKTPKA